MDLSSNEWDFAANAKMFAIGFQGIWFDFAAGGALTGRGRTAAGIWQWLLESEFAKKKLRGQIKESWYDIRKRLMREVERKLEERDADDLLTLLTV